MKKQKNVFMRADRDLLEELKKIKLTKGESYASIVKRLIEKERRLK